MNQSTGVSCRTFYNRLYKCWYYREKESYLKNVKLLFRRILIKFKTRPESIISIFAKEISSCKFTGTRKIQIEDRTEFKDFCSRCAINLSNLFDSFRIDNILDNYLYRWKIKGYISGILHEDKDYNLHLSYENAALVQKELNFFSINNHIYNITHELGNDAIVMSVPHNVYFLIPYNKIDYTIRRGLLTITKANKLRLRGEHCLQCSQSCNPTWINGLDRLRSII